ncbi:8456_t:CDS:2, partial [Dentiscutata erythropus]
MFLQALGLRHIRRGFDTCHTAPWRIQYQPDTESTSKFFELVHIADLIQQMVEICYDEEMSDKPDFFNICIKEKKTFEKNLDESVLIDHVEFVLSRSEEFNPPINTPLDLKPTK